MDYKNALIISLNEKRKKYSYENHWEKKILRPSQHSATCQELIKSTHLNEQTIVQALNELELEGKVKGTFKGTKNCLVLFWELI